MKKIGILGGTFNPIHVGHLKLAEYARCELQLDEVWLMPTGCSYLKDADTIVPAEHRLQMARLAALDYPHIKVSDIEIVRKGNTYTYETLESLREQYPDVKLYFIQGADCLFTIEKWRHPERIFQSCTLVAAVRNATSMEAMEAQRNYLEQKWGAKVHLLTMPEIKISSTEIRERLQQGEAVCGMLSGEVISYIKEKGLYS